MRSTTVHTSSTSRTKESTPQGELNTTRDDLHAHIVIKTAITGLPRSRPGWAAQRPAEPGRQFWCCVRTNSNPLRSASEVASRVANMHCLGLQMSADAEPTAAGLVRRLRARPAAAPRGRRPLLSADWQSATSPWRPTSGF
jgi:hypothetical protein